VLTALVWELLRLPRLLELYLRLALSLVRASKININVAQECRSAQLYLIVFGSLLLRSCLVRLVWRWWSLVRHCWRRLWSLLIWRRRWWHLAPLLGATCHGTSHHLLLLRHARLRRSTPSTVHLAVTHSFHLLLRHLLTVEIRARMRARWAHHGVVGHLRVKLWRHSWRCQLGIREIHVRRR
jgi:hypothetical protein